MWTREWTLPTMQPSWIPLTQRLKEVLAEAGMAKDIDKGWELWSEPQCNTESVAYFIATADTQAVAVQRAAETALCRAEAMTYSYPGFWAIADWLINCLAHLLNLSRPLVAIADDHIHIDVYARELRLGNCEAVAEGILETDAQLEAALRRVVRLCRSLRKAVMQFVRGELRGRPEILLQILLCASVLLGATIALRMLGLEIRGQASPRR